MGVRGLKSFLEHEHQIRQINLDNEIQKWKRCVTHSSLVLFIN